MGIPDAMYLKIRAWCSSSCHCDGVNGNLVLPFIMVNKAARKQYFSGMRERERERERGGGKLAAAQRKPEILGWNGEDRFRRINMKTNQNKDKLRVIAILCSCDGKKYGREGRKKIGEEREGIFI